MKKKSTFRLFIVLILLIEWFQLVGQGFVMNGSATFLGDSCYEITPNEYWLAGSVFSNQPIDLTSSFSLVASLYFGNDDYGADGMVFILGTSNTALGGAAAYLGYGDFPAGITPSIAIEYDTWYNPEDPFYDPFEADHTAVLSMGTCDHSAPTNLVGPYALPNLEDGLNHCFQLSWDINTLTLTATLDGNTISYTGDIVTTIFSGNPLVYYGFSAATGGATNSQRVCFGTSSIVLYPMSDVSVCEGQSTVLQADDNGIAWNWTPDPTLTPLNVSNPTASPSVTTTYYVEITYACGGPALDTVEVTVQESVDPMISGIPTLICEIDNPIPLPIIQDGFIGSWTGIGVNSNIFYPSGLYGSIILIFTPDPDQCAGEATTDIFVEALISISISGIPDSLCQFNSSISLPDVQTGVSGTWSGIGVSNNTFNPAGLNGNIILTFTPDAGICALSANTIISVFQNLYNISGIPQSVCVTDPTLQLTSEQDGITGNWSGPGVINNTFNPSGQNGIVALTFTPDAGECATVQSQNLIVNALVIPSITGLPNSLCENSSPIALLPIQDNINGSWSGPGVSLNIFYPYGLNGNIILTFTPDAGQCALSNTTIIQVNTPLIPMISGVPATSCESDIALDLPTTHSGIDGNWSGPGVFNNTFNPAGQSGTITLTFTPEDGQCASTNEWYITIEIPFIPVISDLPSTICQTDQPISLPDMQNGYSGVWSGPGVINNTFNPNGLSGFITLFFNPDDGQCASAAEVEINVEIAFIPFLSEIPDTLCETDDSFSLPTIQDGIVGNWSGPGVSANTFNPLDQNGNITLIFVPDNGQCALPAVMAISVSPAIIPVITGVPASLCQSDSVLLLPGLQSGITGNWSGLNVNANSFSPSGLNGNYVLTFSPASGQCADTTTIQIAVLTPPSFTNLNAACDTSMESYTVSFEITGGDFASYMVNGVPVNGTIFSSSPYVVDSIQYAFALDDANGCGPVEIQGSMNCACFTNAGTMNFEGSPLMICSGADFAVSFNHDFNLDQDDLLSFILHDNAGTKLGTIFATSEDSTFTFPPGVILGQTYYVSVIAGSNDGTGNIDLNDQCLSVVAGVPVIFYQAEMTINGGGEICPTACMTYNFSFTGEKPFELKYQVKANGTVVDDVLISDTAAVSILICPEDFGLTSGTIDIFPISLSDAHCTVPLFTFPGIQTIVLPSTTSDISNTLCPGQSLSVNGIVYDQSHPSGTEVIQNAAGCDSTVHINLSYYPNAVFDLNQTLCFGNSLLVNGTEYNETHPQGTEIIPGGSIHGCDSVIHIQLAFDSTITAYLSSSLCPGESLTINGHIYDEFNPSGAELFPGGSALGCDSILQVDLLFYPEASSSFNPVLCHGEMIMINGVVYDEDYPSGIEILQHASYNGCDSSILVNLSFHPEAVAVITDTLSYGDSIIIGGKVYNQSNPQGAVFIPNGSVTGCDSSIFITLLYNQGPQIELYAPTIFSPNGDGVNDTWRIYSSDQKAELVSLNIFDRWGGILFSCADQLLNDSAGEWDGKMKGRDMGGGVYVFIAIVKTTNGATRRMKGTITLIR